MIYFAQLPTGAIKIGHSDDVPTRMRQLSDRYGDGLALLATIEGGQPIEAEWHRRFAHLRLERTEQFRPAPELMEAIGRPLLVTADPDAVECLGPVRELTGKPVRLEFEPELHRILRRVAANKDMSMSAYAREVLEKHLRDEARRQGIKV